MSANGTRQDAVSNYHITKQKAEDIVKASGLKFTIFRPSLVYGPSDSFINMLVSFMKKTPVFSYFGDGSYPMQLFMWTRLPNASFGLSTMKRPQG